MKYTVLYFEIIDELIERVNQFIGIGWEPIGGISYADFGDDSYFCQAMVLKPK